jgi:hypothetical protein
MAQITDGTACEKSPGYFLMSEGAIPPQSGISVKYNL